MNDAEPPKQISKKKNEKWTMKMRVEPLSLMKLIAFFYDYEMSANRRNGFIPFNRNGKQRTNQKINAMRLSCNLFS